jgi:hypothetical protein
MISWKSRKQTLVATSTTDAEYIVISEACKELLWLEKLCEEFSIETDKPISFSDNQSAICLTNGNSSHRTKHIDIKYHYVRDYVDQGKFKLQYISTDNNIADILTKPLNGVRIKN